MSRRIKREDILARLRDIAFGNANDAVRLAFLEDGEDVGELDLTLLSEVKRAANGAVEVKLASRAELLKLLLAELDVKNDGSGGARSFFEAIDRAAGGDAE